MEFVANLERVLRSYRWRRQAFYCLYGGYNYLLHRCWAAYQSRDLANALPWSIKKVCYITPSLLSIRCSSWWSWRMKKATLLPKDRIRSPGPWYQYYWISFYPGRGSNPKRAPNKMWQVLGRGAWIAVFVAEIKKTRGWHGRSHHNGKRSNSSEKWKSKSEMLINCLNTFSREGYCCVKMLKNQWITVSVIN